MPETRVTRPAYRSYLFQVLVGISILASMVAIAGVIKWYRAATTQPYGGSNLLFATLHANDLAEQIGIGIFMVIAGGVVALLSAIVAIIIIRRKRVGQEH